ncbi:MAG: DUF4249 domain-containing protein [Bacteroidales bacterium]|nr:DUF4249 domain-containing protein [Bacteroidales bacterium]
MRSTPIIISSVAILIAALMSSCVREIDLDYQRPTPTLVVNSIISPQHDVTVRVAKTVFATNRNTPSHVENATVLLSIDRANPVVLAPRSESLKELQSKGFYTAPLRVQEGQYVKLEVKTPEGNHATTTGKMPRLVPIKDFKHSYVDRIDKEYIPLPDESSGKHTIREFTYEITFSDPAQERNHYFIQVLDEYRSGFDIDYSRNEVFRAQLKAVDLFDASNLLTRREGMTFNDDRFDGQIHTLRLVERNHAPDFYLQQNRKREIRLYSITEDYYRYLTQLTNGDEDVFNSALVEAGLADPPAIHSNIIGGVGILGLMQVDIRHTNIGGK